DIAVVDGAKMAHVVGAPLSKANDTDAHGRGSAHAAQKHRPESALSRGNSGRLIESHVFTAGADDGFPRFDLPERSAIPPRSGEKSGWKNPRRRLGRAVAGICKAARTAARRTRRNLLSAHFWRAPGNGSRRPRSK